MPVLLTHHDQDFPPAAQADEHGIVAVGGDFSPHRLIQAYRAGIFPWPHKGYPLLWFCPDPRFVLEPHKIIINHALRKALRKTSLVIKADHDFMGVMKNCAQINRKGQNETWITRDMLKGYHGLHELGLAHSVEAYENDALVGGLYGIGMGSIFFGESMFFKKTDASKICLVTLAAHLVEWNFTLIDCQAHTHHLEKFGAHPIARKSFLEKIKNNLSSSTRESLWSFYLSPQQALARLQRSELKL